MFALIRNAPPTDTDRLREIDVANESVHDHSAFISRFVATHAYASITAFLAQLNAASASISLSQASAFPHPPSIHAILALLSRIDALIDQHPPVPAANTRFGNPAFRDLVSDLRAHSRDWVQAMLREGGLNVSALPAISTERQQLMEEEDSDDGGPGRPHSHLPQSLPQKVLDSLRARGELPDQHDDHHTHSKPHPHQHEEHKEQDPVPSTKVDPASLSSEERLSRVAAVLCLYLDASFGDQRRIDYGTGHELNFLCCLYCLTTIRFIQLPHAASTPASPSVLSSLSLVVFPRYLSVMRRLQSRYLLEPAGSRGVWGLDDYSFLPFLFGSAQLIGHPHLRPRSIRYPEVLESSSGDFLYLDCVRWVMSLKSVSFAEHSPMLHDITAVKTWQAVNVGLMRMYDAEVLRKFPIVQHFIFTELLSTRLVKPVTQVQVREPELCCSDSIHFPSALSGQQ